jgi:hypothetical protein
MVNLTPWRVGEVWLASIAGGVLAAWIRFDLPYWGAIVCLFGATCVLLGRRMERDAVIHRKLKATAVRPRPVVAARAATEINLRRIHRAQLPDLAHLDHDRYRASPADGGSGRHRLGQPAVGSLPV